MSNVTTIEGCVLDALPLMEAGSVHMCATSPPFWGLRVYSGEPSDWPAVTYTPMSGLAEVEVEAWTGQLGMEPTPEMYVGHLVEVFRLVRRVLRDDGTLWLNLGDSYARNGGTPGGGNREVLHMEGKQCRMTRIPRGCGLKAKDLIGLPWRVAFALQADGWWLRSEIVWAKGVSFCADYAGSVMPESVTDRPTRAHEQVFLLTKKANYYYDNEAVKERTRKEKGSVSVRSWQYFAENADPAGGGYRGDGGLKDRINPGSRNLRSVWLINPEPSSLSHYAGWPSRLVAPMIRAGTSERGVCPACAAPYERVVEKAGQFKSPEGRTSLYADNGARGKAGTTSVFRTGTVAITKTLGWRPTCRCEAAEPVPATVLDIFGGTGTTADVAWRLGRRCVLVDRSSAYVEMQHERLAQQELF
ncbi:MAG: site-specific DNA-methyltransferase [Rhodothermales bacterium]